MALKRDTGRPDPFADKPVRYCETVGCEQVALSWAKVCDGCDNRLRYERAKTNNEARGIRSPEQAREYCKRLFRKRFFESNKPSFERWAETMTQATVDVMVTMATRSDERVLERLKSICALTDDFKLVPVEERAARRAAIEAQRKAEQERIDAALKAQGVVRRDLNTEGAT